MNQKQQNSHLVALKQEFASLMDEIESCVIEGAELIDGKTLNENTLDWVQTYLSGDCNLKEMRAGIARGTI